MSPNTIFLPYLFFITILLYSQLHKAAAGYCQEKCGETEIPYPFGTKEGCYLDAAFKVTCNESTSTASLASLGWEVVDINVSNHSLRRKDYNVQTFKAISNDWINRSLHLAPEDSQYFILHTKNKFIIKACDVLAYLDGGEGLTLGACASACNNNTKGNIPLAPSTCQGLNCCQMDLLKDIRNCSLYVAGLGNSTDGCGFFTFIDSDYLHLHLNFSKCSKRYTVPVVYEWIVGNKSCKEGNICSDNSRCINSTTHTGYKCICKGGFQGNPYQRDGCRDIDECKESKRHRCLKNSRCINTQGSYYCLPNRRHMLALIIPLGIGLAVGLLILIGISLWMRRKIEMVSDRKTKQRFFKRNGGLLLQQQVSSSLQEPTLFKIEELEKATDKFSESRVLGKGGIGTVYKGMLSDGRIVAVKKANISNDNQIGQFVNEVCILSQISHRHIVRLFGCCMESESPLLVYEYVSNGTLSHHIHDEPEPGCHSKLSWENRLRIAAEVAGALAYLHSYASTAIFHRDIKSSNILLDENYRAVVSDFGLSRSVPLDRTHLTTFVGGTFGYLDPEYFQSGQLSEKSDVYAFGVVVAEILTGRKAVSSARDDIGLANHFRSAVKQGILSEIVEAVVAEDGQGDQVLAVAKLAKRCIKANSRKRPSMKEVAAELGHLRNTKELNKRDDDEHGSKSDEVELEAGDDQTISE